MIERAATVRDHDPATGAGSVILDDGLVVGYSGEAFWPSGLQLLRPGQRVRLRVSGDVASGNETARTILAITLTTFELH